MKPWLIEVNCMPSLRCDSGFDTTLKFSVIRGTLKILDLSPSFKKIILQRQKAIIQKRMIGITDAPIAPIFDSKTESEIARTTHWRQLYPFEDESCEISQIVQNVIKYSKESPVGAAVETVASRARKEAIKQKQLEINPPVQKPRLVKKAMEKKIVPERPVNERVTEKSANEKSTERLVLEKTPMSIPTDIPRCANVTRKSLSLTANASTPILPTRNSTRDDDIQQCSPSMFLLPNLVLDSEEKNRLKYVRTQILLGQSVNMLQRVKLLLNQVNPQFSVQDESSKSRYRNDKVFVPGHNPKPFVKPVVVYRQVMLNEN